MKNTLIKKTNVDKNATHKAKTTVKTKRQKKSIAKQKLEELEQQEQEDIDATKPKNTFENDVETSFFYTNDKFINALDNETIIKEIQKKYPDLNEKNTDGIIKKNIVRFLEDEKYVNTILEFYNLTIFDLFKMLYKSFSTIFKGMYLVKIRNAISNKKYVKLPVRRKHK